MGIKTEEIAKIEDFMVWKSIEPDEETYHIEMGRATIHFFIEEWEEFLEFAADMVKIPLGTTGTIAETESYEAVCEEIDGDIIYSIEMPGVLLSFFEDDWKLVIDLIKEVLSKQ